MYLPFYGFTESPFNLTPDSKFLFMSHHHQEALAALMFGVQERKGFICLTGEIGCGKTTLCRAMLSQFDPEKTKTCILLNSYLSDLELLKSINEEFGLDAASDSKKQLLDRLNEFLVREFTAGHNVILIIDESQNLRPETLEQIRMISNLETETSKLIQIILVGQPELRRTLGLPELEQLNQRITVRYHITPLQIDEVSEYIRHRLAVAQPQVDVTFTNKACNLIHHFSRGVPRRINVICDRCLLIGYIKGAFEIDDRMVEQAVDELRGENPAAASEISGEKRGLISRATLGWAVAVLGFAAVAGIGVYVGMTVASRNAPATTNALVKPTPAPRQIAATNPDESAADNGATDAAATPKPSPSPTPTPKPTATASPSPTASPTPTPTPTPKPTPKLYDNWQLDRENVLRVRDPRLAQAAAMINLIKQWQTGEIDVELLKKDPVEKVERYIWPATVAQPGLDFKTFETANFADALRLDLPLAVALNENADGAAPWGVVVKMQGNVLEYIDPIFGRQHVRRDKLEGTVRLARAIYLDPMNLTGLAMGSEGDTVAKLQQWLIAHGSTDIQPDGKFGPMTRDAVSKIQRLEGLNPTGEIDPPTAMRIGADSIPGRPHLFL